MRLSKSILLYFFLIQMCFFYFFYFIPLSLSFYIQIAQLPRFFFFVSSLLSFTFAVCVSCCCCCFFFPSLLKPFVCLIHSLPLLHYPFIWFRTRKCIIYIHTTYNIYDFVLLLLFNGLKDKGPTRNNFHSLDCDHDKEPCTRRTTKKWFMRKKNRVCVFVNCGLKTAGVK